MRMMLLVGLLALAGCVTQPGFGAMPPDQTDWSGVSAGVAKTTAH